MVIRYSVKEFEDMCGDTVECVQVLMDVKPIGVLLSDDDECPYAVVEYEGGRYSVCGARSDGEVDYETAMLFLELKRRRVSDDNVRKSCTADETVCRRVV